MRAAIIVALLLQSSIVYAQEIEGFAGVKWGDSCQTAMKTLADKWPYERTAATFRQELADGDGCKTSLVSITKIGTWKGDTAATFGWLISGTPVTVRMVINPTAGLKRGTRGLVEAFVMFRSSYYQKILDAFSGAYG